MSIITEPREERARVNVIRLDSAPAAESAAADQAAPGTGVRWSVRATSGPVPDAVAGARRPVPATVPGEVQLDLVAAGLIPDPFDGDGEAETAWVGYCDWRYETTFDWHDDGEARQDLVADGLDTAATLTLNGHEVARTANQHRSYRFDLRGLLVEGENTLIVDFRSPIEFAREQERLLGELPRVMHHPFNAVRKTASNFGWDWGIDVSSSGIWKSLRLESWSGVRVAAVRPLVAVSDGCAELTTHVDLEWADAAAGDTAHRLVVEVAGSRAEVELTAGQAAVTAHVDAGSVENGEVELWWPRGHGAQPLYEVTVTVASDADPDEARWRGRVGFRTIEVDTTPDRDGTPFTITVNGEPIYARGVNWIPGDAFLTRMTRERYRNALQDAVEAGVNLVRVWGGGIYESEDFYDFCDEAGLLVWQDFLFACAAYAEEEPLRGEVEAEAREAITRLSAHPSLAIWNGCNENIWGYVEWDWRRHLVGRTWGEGYYTGLLPDLVAELDPTRPYSPGSPFSFMPFAHPNDPRNGTMHIWDVWNERDYTAYAEHRPRFASEFGFQGPPAWSTLTRAVHDEPLEPDGTQLLVHQKADHGNLKLERGLGDHLPRPADMAHWHWATQLNQARAVAFAIEHFRALHPLNTGAIVWQLNDDWPVVSWAAVDYDGHRKPLWHALRRVYADRLVSVHRAGDLGGPEAGAVGIAAAGDGADGASAERADPDALVAALHNDSAEPWHARLVVERGRVEGGESSARHEIAVEVPARAATSIPLPPEVTVPERPEHEYLRVRVADGGAEDAWHWFVEDARLRLAPQDDALRLVEVETLDADTLSVTVVADSLAKDVAVQADRLAPRAAADTALVTLAAGESHRFVIRGAGGVFSADEVGLFPVLCSVNELVSR